MNGLSEKVHQLYRLTFDFVRKNIFIFILSTCLCACSKPVPIVSLDDIPGPRGDLTLEVYGFRTLQGKILISLFREIEGFPDETEKALLNLGIAVKTGRQQITLPRLPWGKYSYSILHDENGNGEMDRNLLGIPREGYALSNGLEGFFGQPDPEEALFEIGADPLHHALRIHYFKRRGKKSLSP